MSSYGRYIAGKQPDGTQGIATVELIFQTGNGNPTKQLVGCAIHLSKKDTSFRNILKVNEEKNKEVKYFIFVACFDRSCRPKENSLKIKVKLHRYKKEEKVKEFSVDENESSKIFEKYENDDYFVIPCTENNFKKSSFLKKWSSELLLHNDSRQVLQRSSSFHGFKKEKKLFKYCRDIPEEFDNLEDQGVLLIRQETCEGKGYVIGCYKKENGSIKKYCFLLRGLEEVADQTDNPPPEQYLSDTSDGGRNNPPPEPTPSGSSGGGRNTLPPEQPPSENSNDGGRNNPPPEPTPSGTGDGGRNNPPPEPTPSGTGDGGRNNPPPEQTPSGSSGGGRNNPPPEQPPSGTGDGGRNNPPPEQTPSGSSGGGRNNPPPEQHPSDTSDGGRNNPPPEQPPSGTGDGGRNNPLPEQPPSGTGDGGRNNPPPEQTPSSMIEEGRESTTREQPPSTIAEGIQRNAEQAQESEDGRISSSELVALPQIQNLPRNFEDKVAMRRELIHTFGPKIENMPHDVTHQVGLMLNPIQRIKGNDYRMVAGKIGLEYHEINNLSQGNPMKDIFDVMIARATEVDEFVNILFEIKRGDVVKKMYEMALDYQLSQ